MTSTVKKEEVEPGAKTRERDKGRKKSCGHPVVILWSPLKVGFVTRLGEQLPVVPSGLARTVSSS